MSQMTPEVAKLLEQALSLSVEEQEALADSLISNLGGKVDEGVLAAWDEEIKKRIVDLDSGKAKTIPWTGSSPAQFGEAATCPLERSTCMRKQPPTTTLLLIGIWSVARMQPELSIWNLSMRSHKSRKLLSGGHAGHLGAPVLASPLPLPCDLSRTGPKHNTGACPRPHKPKT